MIVTVFGANGKVGRLIVQKLLDDNYEVVAFVHSSSSLPENKKLKIVKGDVHNSKDVEKAINGSEVVVSALGSWGTKQKDIVSKGTENIVKALYLEGKTRVITLTGSDALAKGDKIGLLGRLVHSLIKLTPAKRILKDGELHISYLEASDLNWTVVRSPVMNNRGNPNSYKLSDKKPQLWSTINRRSVALAMVKAIRDPESHRKALYITRQK